MGRDQIIEKIKKKYDPFKNSGNDEGPEEEKKLEDWKDSMAVCRLSEYLKMHAGKGIMLVAIDGNPALHFEPGLRRKDKDRWDVALNAVELFQEAIDDLQGLMGRSLLTLKNGGSFPRSPVTRGAEARDLATFEKKSGLENGTY